MFVWNIILKLNAGCNEFEPNKVNCRMCLSAEENKRKKVKKKKRKKWYRQIWK